MSSQTVPLRKLGKGGPSVPAMGLGMMGMSMMYGAAPSDEERFKLLDRAVELGETFWDTADMYGDSEEMLGRWFERTGKRNDIFLASKFGILMEPGLVFKGIDSSYDYCKKACAASLQKLKTDHLDLFYAHRVNPDTPIEETMRALAELQSEGKIKHIGLSEITAGTLRRASRIARVAAVQVEYSAFVRDVEGAAGTHLLHACRELGVALVGYAPLGRGLLTASFPSRAALQTAGDFRAQTFPWFGPDNFDANRRVVDRFKALAQARGCSASQLAIAWLLKQGEDVIPIPGTKKIKYLEENWESLKVQLSDQDEAEIRRFVENAGVAGHHSVEAGLADTREEK